MCTQPSRVLTFSRNKTKQTTMSRPQTPRSPIDEICRTIRFNANDSDEAQAASSAKSCPLQRYAEKKLLRLDHAFEEVFHPAFIKAADNNVYCEDLSLKQICCKSNKVEDHAELDKLNTYFEDTQCEANLTDHLPVPLWYMRSMMAICFKMYNKTVVEPQQELIVRSNNAMSVIHDDVHERLDKMQEKQDKLEETIRQQRAQIEHLKDVLDERTSRILMLEAHSAEDELELARVKKIVQGKFDDVDHDLIAHRRAFNRVQNKLIDFNEAYNNQTRRLLQLDEDIRALNATCVKVPARKRKRESAEDRAFSQILANGGTFDETCYEIFEERENAKKQKKDNLECEEEL